MVSLMKSVSWYCQCRLDRQPSNRVVVTVSVWIAEGVDDAVDVVYALWRGRADGDVRGGGAPFPA